MALTEHDLLDLKKEIEEAKTKTAELKGQEKQLMETLKKDWECKTVEEAEQKLKTIAKDLGKLSQQIEEGVAEIEEKYFTEE